MEKIATGEPLTDTLDLLCRQVERLLDDVRCTVVMIEDDKIRPLAAPAMPPFYAEAINGVPVGPCAGSCGTAAWTRHPVVVTDIATDPLWDGFRELVLPLGLRACWSSPIVDNHGVSIGCFAFYYREPRGPTLLERSVVDACLHLCMIAIDRARSVAAHHALVYRDALTGLGNRAAFEETIASPRADGWALMLIDVDDLKTVNDMFGHRAGDGMITTVAHRVADIVTRPRAFRIGGDELPVLIESAEPEAEVERLSKTLLATIDHPADCAGQMLTPSISIGAAIVVPGSDTAHEIVRRHADLALYHAKSTGKGGFVCHTPRLGTRIARRLAAVRTVRAAIANDAIAPYYQPIVDLATRTPIGLEALCRIRTSEGVIVAGDTLQDALTDAHVAVDITRLMLAKICDDLRGMRDAGLTIRPVAINLSPFDFRRPGIARSILDALDAVGMPRSALAIEVTELVSLGRHNDVVTAELAELRRNGISAALDDFGTGFASLSHLLSMSVDTIKIDRSFVGDGPRGFAIIDGVARIAGALGIRIIVEGVEEEAQAWALARLGCQAVQGFRFAPPMPLAKTIDYLAAFEPLPPAVVVQPLRRVG
ncbi:EAL domain-containing protein [Sphingomonas nostoxanthinifaciens]|uniref:EAL domain-containing protein n=1 Tax=Sphingomonas nostoxanthinifaciens TaxID=2872652 RepID=UPI001CC202E8|nr:EAL domain-containing protein [Sphingomonas nostoxanthinifaciens]UAK26088.1 EAL domain-containing protein [Sphingomonas nostoxanthinifaciens]